MVASSQALTGMHVLCENFIGQSKSKLNSDDRILDDAEVMMTIPDPFSGSDES